MKIKTPTEFQTFNDGTAYIYETENNKRSQLRLTVRFGNRVVGYKRHFTARAANVSISRLIHIPLNTSVAATDRVVIGTDEYKIEQIQPLTDTNPPVSVLTLVRIVR